MKSGHFFKIFSVSNLQDNKLKIPRKFTHKYGKKFGASVLLKVPGGPVCRVELKMLNGNIWLCNGWKQFADYYSIGFGYVLVFKYKGHSTLYVTIFDMSACEIEYPKKPDHAEQCLKKSDLKVPVEGEIEDDEPVQISEGNPGTLQRAQGFKSEKPFFLARMGRSTVSGKCGMYIPKDFAEKNLGENCSDVVVQESGGRTWSGKCWFDNKTGYCRLYMPRRFLRENGLKVGDVCRFEMLNHDEPRLKVLIFREIE